MTAICFIVKPAQLSIKALDGMVKVESVNKESSLHIRPYLGIKKPLTRRPGGP
jgi:hypothetical protein